MKNYEKPEINVTSFEVNNNMMLSTSVNVQSTFTDTVDFSEIHF